MAQLRCAKDPASFRSGGCASASASSALSPAIPSRMAATSACTSPLKKEATRPTARNFLQQQATFDDFTHCYNPHGGYPAHVTYVTGIHPSEIGGEGDSHITGL